MDALAQAKRLGATWWPRREAARGAGARRRLVFALTGFAGYYLSRPTPRDALFRPRPRRRRRHRLGADGGRHSLRRQLRRRDRAVAGRPDRAGAHDARGKGAAAQRQRRQRTLRQARLARPHLVHAGSDARARDRRRTRAHHPDDARRQGRARAYRARRRGLVPPRAPAALGLRHHPHRRRRRSTPPARRSAISSPPPCRT